MTVKYPTVQVVLVGEDGNAFNIIGKVAAALRRSADREAEADYVNSAMECGSYDDLLKLTMDTVEIL